MSIEKTLGRVNLRIKSNEFYEAHQLVRTVVARYNRQKLYDDSIAVLYNSCVLLGRAGQTGSVADLALYLLQILTTADITISGPSRGRLCQVISYLDFQDSSAKQIAQQAAQWSNNDPEVMHVLGSLFAASNSPYEAEKYLFCGTKDSVSVLAKLHLEWASLDSEKSNSWIYVSRGVLGYLTKGDFKSLFAYIELTIPTLADSSADTVNDLTYFEDQPMMNFLQLLPKVCLTRNRTPYQELIRRFDAKKFTALTPSLVAIEDVYFGIRPQKAFNPMDLLGMFK